EHAAAGLWTTPTELVTIGRALSKSYRRGGFLKKKTARRMMTPVKDYYGLGVMRINADTLGEETAAQFGSDVAYHDGENAGFLTEWIVSLERDVCVASMINRSDDAACGAQFDVACEIFRKAKE
ncbi:MAG: hypothetical protein IKX41_03855, partial [Oscillospiraceae bacterium]|nr:hypothetical protein [Oscillospiraceae bacterium]